MIIRGQNSYPLPHLHPRSVPGLPTCQAGIRRLPWHYTEVPPSGWWMSPGVWLAVGSSGPCRERWAYLTEPPRHPDQPISITIISTFAYIFPYMKLQRNENIIFCIKFFSGSRWQKKISWHQLIVDWCIILLK